MSVGADCIQDLDLIRFGGMPQLFDGVYAPATLGILLREFTFGHTKQLASAARRIWSPLPGGPRYSLARSSGCSTTSTRCCAQAQTGYYYP
jgi:hypothetical protein